MANTDDKVKVNELFPLCSIHAFKHFFGELKSDENQTESGELTNQNYESWDGFHRVKYEDFCLECKSQIKTKNK